MSRSCYSDDYGDDFPGQLGLYRGNVDRSLASKAGQARLRELRAALEVMPVKRLEADMFIGPKGEACALGQWAIERAKTDPAANDLRQFYGADEETADVLAPFGWPKLVVYEAIYRNDTTEWVDEPPAEGPHRDAWHYRGYPVIGGWSDGWPVIYRRPENAEERHARVLAWVNEQLIEASR